MKKTELLASLPSIGNQGRTDIQGVTACRNLRPAPGRPGRLIPVDDLSAIASGLAGAKILGTAFMRNAGECLFLARGNTLTVITGVDDAAAEPISFTMPELTAPPMAVVTTGEETVVMTADGPYTLSLDDGGTPGMRKADDRPPCLRLEVAMPTRMAATVNPVPFSGSYDGRTSTRLTQADLKRLKAELIEAYNRLMDTADHANMLVEPRLLRYRYLDAMGRTVHLSAVRLILPSPEVAFSEPFILNATTDGLASSTIYAEGARLTLSTPEPSEQWDAAVASVVVEMSAPVPLFNPALARLDHAADFADGRLRVMLPGSAVDMAFDYGCFRGRALAMLADFESHAAAVLRIDSPFSHNASKEWTLTVPPRPDTPSGQTADTLKKLKNQARQWPDGEVAARCSLPHSFAATAAASAGGAVVWANPTALPFRGWSVADWALTTEPETSWQGCVIIEMADGSRAVSTSRGSSHAPLSLTPMLGHPLPEAVAMEIRVKTALGTAIHRVNLASLHPAPLAVVKDFSTAPIPLHYSPDVDYVVPSTTLLPRSFPGVLLTAHRDNPLQPTGSLTAGATPIVRLTPATASSSAWDYARSRFYGFSPSGISLVAVNSDGRPASVQQIDSRPVVAAEHVSFNSGSGGVAAIAGRSMVMVKGARAEEMAGTMGDGTLSLAYDGDDLWILGRENRVTVLPADHPTEFYIRDIPTIQSMDSSLTRHLFVIDGQGRILDGRRRYVTSKEVEWSCRFFLGDSVRPPVRGAFSTAARITAIGLRIVASAIRARLTATGDYGSASMAIARLLLSVLIDGSLRNGLHLPVRAPRTSWLTLTLRGTVDPDTRIHGLTVFTDV